VASSPQERPSGEYRTLSKITFADYAAGWIDTYQGRTSRGIDESTRADYRKRLEQDAIPFFARSPLAAIEPRHLKEYVRHLAAPRTAAELENGRRRRTIAPSTVRLGVAPVRALFATAVEEGLIRSNPAAGLRIAVQRETFDESGASETDVKALSAEDLAGLLAELDDEWRLFFGFLGQTGLRIGEAIELRWRDVDLGAGTVRVRRRFYRGRVGPPKSKYGRRTIRLAPGMVRSLWQLRKATRAGDDELVFTAERGGRIEPSNLMSRILKPAARVAGLGEWVGFHTFRHTCATMLFRAGWNAVQVQRFLGHHKASFTLDTYVHLLEEDFP